MKQGVERCEVIMKILFISSLDFKKKSIQVIRKTPEAYIEKGHEVYYITYRDEDKDSNYFYEEIFDPKGVVVHRISLPFSNLLRHITNVKLKSIIRKLRILFFYLPMALLKAAKIITHKKIDLLYGYESHGVIAANILKIIFRLPVVSRFQGTKLTPFVERNNHLKILRKFDQYLALKLPGDLTIMTDDGTKGDFVLKKINSHVRKLLFLKNGVDKELFNPDFDIEKFKVQKGIEADHPMLLTVSRLVLWKRVDRAIQVLYKIKNLLLGVDNTKKIPILVIVGDGNYRDSLENLVRILRLENDVYFMGAVDYNEVPYYMNAANIFLSFYDLSNVGNPLLEALVCQVPIITLNNGDTGSVIQNGVNGVLIEIDEESIMIEEAARSAISILTDKSMRERLSLGAKEYSEKLLSWKERLEKEVCEVEKLVREKTISTDWSNCEFCSEPLTFAQNL